MAMSGFDVPGPERPIDAEVAVMRNNVKAAYESGAAREAPRNSRRSRSQRVLVGRLLVLSLAIALIAPSAIALGQTTTGYNQTPPPPKTETTTGYNQTPPAPKTETTPAKTGTTPAKQEVAPTKTSTAPAATQEAKPTSTAGEPTRTAAPSAARTLPFTGLDLRWVIIGGVFLLGAGLSIVFVQRGRRGMGR